MIKTFYGKPVNELTENELKLLTLDIMLTSEINCSDKKLKKRMQSNLETLKSRCLGMLACSMENKCKSDNYSREKFYKEFYEGVENPPKDVKTRIDELMIEEIGVDKHDVIMGKLSELFDLINKPGNKKDIEEELKDIGVHINKDKEEDK